MSSALHRPALVAVGGIVVAAPLASWAATGAPGATVAGLGAGVWLIAVTLASSVAGLLCGVRRGTVWALAACAPVVAWMLGSGAGAASLSAALPVAACALWGLGAATALARVGVTRDAAVLSPVVAVVVLAGLPLVADPWIEWDGSTAASPARAARVVALDPVSSIGSPVDGVAWDRQRGRVLYSGAGGDGQGLSVIGQYYPARPTSTWLWGAVVGGLGFVLAAFGAALDRDRTATMGA